MNVCELNSNTIPGNPYGKQRLPKEYLSKK